MRAVSLHFFVLAVVGGIAGCGEDGVGPVDGSDVAGAENLGGSGTGRVKRASAQGGDTGNSSSNATGSGATIVRTTGKATSSGTGGARWRETGAIDTAVSPATGGSRSITSSTQSIAARGGGRNASTANASGGNSASSGTTAPTTGTAPLKKFVGNITTSFNSSVDYGGKTFSKYWDQITPENAGKWGSVQSMAGGGYNWKSLDAIYDYAQKNNIIFKQHAFVWGTQQPGGTPSAAQVQEWMKEFCGRYPLTRIVDVVNEPPPHTTPNYINNMGGGTNGDWKWIANAFIWARAACPDAILLLNDFNNIEWTDDNNRIINIVSKIKAQNAPIDGIGCQAHDLDYGGNINLNAVKGFATKLHEQTGLPLYITEMDISTIDDNAQLAKYKEFMPFFLETEWIHGITIWGWHYGQTWSSAPNSGLVRNGNFRPAMTWLMETLGRPTT